MTATLSSPPNGRVPRKNLAGQLDRLDNILDGLDQALAGAITDAVREAVSVATAEAVRATLVEIVSNPDVIAMLRPAPAPVIPSAVPSTPSMIHHAPAAAPQPNVFHRAWRWTIGKLKAVGEGISARLRGIRNGVASTYRQASAIWSLKRPALIALGVGAVIGMICFASSPWLAGIVSGLVASVAALGVQLAMWARRVFAYLPAAH